jgi:Domain of unknown function (DUF4253)
MDKFDLLREKGTCAVNYGIPTEDLVDELSIWDETYGISHISNVEEDRVTVHFQRLPENLDELAEEIEEFCPDIVQQGFDNYPGYVELDDQFSAEAIAEMRDLMEGVDIDSADCGMELLKKYLLKHKSIELWWD